MHYAVVDINNIVINIVNWDGVSNWTPPPNTQIINIPNNMSVKLGATYINGVFTNPVFSGPQPVPVLTLDDIYDSTISANRVFKAIVLSINDGSLTVGGNKTAQQLKTIIKAKM